MHTTLLTGFVLYLWLQIPNGASVLPVIPTMFSKWIYLYTFKFNSAVSLLPSYITYSAFPTITVKQVALVGSPGTLDLIFSPLSRISFQQLSSLSSKHQSLTLYRLLCFSTQTYCDIIHLKEKHLIFSIMVNGLLATFCLQVGLILLWSSFWAQGGFYITHQPLLEP